MFIKIKGYTGKHNCYVIEFRKYNFEELYSVIKNAYRRFIGGEIPTDYENIKTIKGLKEFIKEYNLNELDYPMGFKYIDGVYCFYQAYG